MIGNGVAEVSTSAFFYLKLKLMDNLSRLKQLLRWKKSKEYYAKKLNISVDEVEELLKRLKFSTQDEIEGTFDMSFEGYWDTYPTPEDIIKRYNINTEKWRLSNVWIKEKGNKIVCSSHFVQVRKSYEIDINTDELIQKLNEYKPSHNQIEILKKEKFYQSSEKVCVLLNLTDIHIDKKHLNEKENNIFERIEFLKSKISLFVERSSILYEIKRIVLIIGSDLFDTDTYNGTTTKGTVQEDTIVRWNESFMLMFDFFVYLINYLKEYALEGLDVIFMQGNHDRTKSFYLVYALHKYFEKEKQVRFDVGVAKRKFVLYGDTFIGLHHGDCKIKDLPIVFSKEFYKEWGRAKYHEIIVGHLHWYMEDGKTGVRIKQFPSVSGVNDWSDMNNYVSADRALICLVYDEKKGRITEFEEKI